MLSVGPVPREERHRDGPATQQRKLASGIRRSKCAGEDDAPLSVVVHRLGAYPTPGQRVEPFDASRQPGHTSIPRAAVPPPLINGTARATHQEVRTLHPRGNRDGELYGQLIRPKGWRSEERRVGKE